MPIAVFSDGTVVGDSTKIVDKVAGSEALWKFHFLVATLAVDRVGLRIFEDV